MKCKVFVLFMVARKRIPGRRLFYDGRIGISVWNESSFWETGNVEIFWIIFVVVTSRMVEWWV